LGANRYLSATSTLSCLSLEGERHYNARDFSFDIGYKLKLGKRLKQIETLVGDDYHHIWDCCCDHGLLGAALLSRQAATHIHFVDIVPELIETLTAKLRQFHPQDNRAQWQTYCMDVTQLPLGDKAGKQLVIIAGVGGDLMTEIVATVSANHPNADVDFLLCPVHHQFTLRQKLNQLNFKLKHECLVEENQRCYEVMLVTPTNAPLANVSLVGEQLWQSTTPEQAKIARNYLAKTLAHYQRGRRSNPVDIEPILKAYQAITL